MGLISFSFNSAIIVISVLFFISIFFAWFKRRLGIKKNIEEEQKDIFPQEMISDLHRLKDLHGQPKTPNNKNKDKKIAKPFIPPDPDKQALSAVMEESPDSFEKLEFEKDISFSENNEETNTTVLVAEIKEEIKSLEEKEKKVEELEASLEKEEINTHSDPIPECVKEEIKLQSHEEKKTITSSLVSNETQDNMEKNGDNVFELHKITEKKIDETQSEKEIEKKENLIKSPSFDHKIEIVFDNIVAHCDDEIKPKINLEEKKDNCNLKEAKDKMLKTEDKISQNQGEKKIEITRKPSENIFTEEKQDINIAPTFEKDEKIFFDKNNEEKDTIDIINKKIKSEDNIIEKINLPEPIIVPDPNAFNCENGNKLYGAQDIIGLLHNYPDIFLNHFNAGHFEAWLRDFFNNALSDAFSHYRHKNLADDEVLSHINALLNAYLTLSDEAFSTFVDHMLEPDKF